MYEQKQMPEMPSDEEVGHAMDTLICLAMHMGGAFSGVSIRTPTDENEGREEYYFHFDLHDSRVCGCNDAPELVATPLDKKQVN